MKKILVCYALLATAAAWVCFCMYAERDNDVRRLNHNSTVLRDSVLHYRTRMNEEAASVGVLELKCAEYARLREGDARRIRDMGIRLNRLESASKTAVETRVEITAAIGDSVAARGEENRPFRWDDGWISVEGRIFGDSVECAVTSIDTLHQVVHRVPRRFLFIRYGTKAVRQDIVSSNPHTSIVATEYIEFSSHRRRKKR